MGQRPAVDWSEEGGLLGLAAAPDLTAYIPSVQARWLVDNPSLRWQELDASLVMADVSGFTPLAERLARRGKIGAEELTDVLNTVFRDLLSLAAGQGGDCLKFGGDAIFLMFTGTGHADRACAAAAAMQRALSPGGSLARALGSTKLKLSLGVHSGRVQLFLAGRTHEELVVAGPAVSETLAMEAAAGAGEVMISEATRTLVGDQVGGREAGVSLLATAPSPPFSLIDRTPVGGPAASGVPVALRDYLTGEPNEGEHRLSAVAFVAFTGTDGLIRSEGVQAASVALDELVTTVQEACVRWGVTFLSTDVNRDGGKMILVAGVPNASRDAEEQVLRAVLDVLGTPRRLPVRAGVNRGRIFAVDLGGRERRTYTVIGDAVNLAARVAFKAEAGQLVATEAVVERTRNAFVLDELEPFMVKGKSEPIRAYLVKQGHGTRPEAAPQALRLIGRAREIAVLRDALAGAHEGVGRIVELVGEPGIGKSRLLAETSRLAHGLAQVAFEGGQYAQGTPYFAVRAPLRGLIGVAAESAVADVEHTLSVTVDRLVPHLAPWLPLIGIAFGLELADTPTTSRINPAFRRIKLNAVTVEFLEALLVEPTLLTIEDAHWLDGGSADLFAMLLQGAGRRPWAVVVTRREVADGFKAPDELATTLPIEPLDVAGSMTMAEAVADDHPLPSYVLADLAARSAGNPLFLQELLAAAQLGPMAELPDTVEAIMASTIDTLDPADRRTLRSAAVLGSRFTVNELIAMLADESSEPGRSEQASVTMPALARLGHFLIPEGPDRLRFRHVLLREVAYEGLAYRSRRQLHGRAGEFIERASGSRADEAAELLALHFHAARRFDRSWHYSRLAAARARRNAALAEAVTFLQRALEAARALRNVPEAEVAEVCEELGDVCELSGRYAEAADAYARSRRRRRSDPVALAYLCRKDGRVRERSTRYSAALRWYTRGFTHLDAAMARGTDERVLSTARARLTLSRGSALVQQGRYREGVPLLKEVVRLASELHEQSMLGHACYMLDWALTDTGSPERHRYRQLVIDIYRQLDADDRKGTALMNLGAHVYYEGQWNEAIAYYREAQVCQERGGDLIGRAMTINNTAEILCDQGHLEEAKGLFRETLRVVRAAPFTIGIGFALANLGLVAIRSGEFGEAAELLAAARPLFESAGAMDMVLFTETKEVELLVSSNRPEEGLALADVVLERFAQHSGGTPTLPAMLHRFAGQALAQLGRLPEAHHRLELSLVAAETAEAEYEVACALNALACLPSPTGDGRSAGARAMAARATAIFRRLGVIKVPNIPLGRATTEALEAVTVGQSAGAPAVIPA